MNVIAGFLLTNDEVNLTAILSGVFFLAVAGIVEYMIYKIHEKPQKNCGNTLA
jgi:hypothetical protein